MVKNLLDLWILKDCGIIIFSKVNNPIFDDQCLAGIISALSYFVKSKLCETLTHFSTDKFQYNLIRKHNILFVGRFSRFTGQKLILQELNYIADQFFIRYPKQILDRWDYNINRFAAFQEALAEL